MSRLDRKACRAVPRNHDTVDVYLPTGHLLVVFSAEPKVIEEEAACWLAFVRDPGNDESAFTLLFRGWPECVRPMFERKGWPLVPLVLDPSAARGQP